jgi:hypothetical protein
MGRKAKALTDEQIGQVETLASVLSLGQLADFLGISENTFRKLRTEDARIDESYKRGKAKAIAGVAQGLLQKAKGGNTTAQIFYLKTQAGWREVDKLVVGGEGDGPIEVVVTRTIVKKKDGEG